MSSQIFLVGDEARQVCTIPSCDQTASTICRYNVSRRTAQLAKYEPIETKGIPAAIYLCPAHAKSFYPPVGWELLKAENKIEREIEMDTEMDTDMDTETTPLLDRAFRNTRQLS